MDLENHPDRVHSLPGLMDGMTLPSRWFSGYLNYTLHDRIMHTHYLYMEMEEEENDVEERLIYWSNGGPGASSMMGLFTELGPLQVSEWSFQTDDYRRTNIPSLFLNPHRWTKLGHLLIFDGPPPVGFSYCEDEKDSSSEKETENDDDDDSCGGWDDSSASLNNYMALKAFYEAFPHLRDLDLYLTGESYAGIYIPTLAKRIMDGNQDLEEKDISRSSSSFIPLKGFAVGDGCVGIDTNVCPMELFTDNAFFETLFLAGHHQIPLTTFHEFLEKCDYLLLNDDDENEEDIMNSLLRGNNHNHEQSPACKKVLDKVKKQVGGYFMYSLYDDCTYQEGGLLSRRNLAKDVSTKNVMRSVGGGAVNNFPCGGGNAMGIYMNISDVLDALHVKGPFFITDDGIGFNYTMSERSVVPIYQRAAKMGDDMRVLIYNGDTDPRINSFAAQNWTSKLLNLKEIAEWRPWTLDDCRRMGGYVIQYEGNVDFLTIRGAGHMVPTYKPEATYVFLKSWLEDAIYPNYHANCTKPPPPLTKAKAVQQMMQNEQENNKKEQDIVE